LIDDLVAGMTTYKGRPKYSKRDLSQFHFFQQKYKMNWKWRWTSTVRSRQLTDSWHDPNVNYPFCTFGTVQAVISDIYILKNH